MPAAPFAPGSDPFAIIHGRMIRSLEAVALAAAARWSGFAPALPPPPQDSAFVLSSPQDAPASVPRLLFRVPLGEIAEGQAGAFLSERVGGEPLDFSLGFDPAYEPWAKLRQEGMFAAFPRGRLERGVELDFPRGRYRISYADGALFAASTREDSRASPAVTPGRSVRVPARSLLDALYERGRPAVFPPVRYVILFEDGGLLPPSVAMLRRDVEGTYWTACRNLDALRALHWLLAVDGIMFGMRWEGEALAFYSKPVPPAGKPFFPSERAVSSLSPMP